jgi:hypothetical protein
VKTVTLRGDSVAEDSRFDPCIIEHAVTSGHELTVRVLYVGGCATHCFDLFEDMSRREELVVIDLLLAHDAKGDTCKAMVREELTFDLSTLEAKHDSDLANGQLKLQLHAGRAPDVYELP